MWFVFIQGLNMSEIDRITLPPPPEENICDLVFIAENDVRHFFAWMLKNILNYRNGQGKECAKWTESMFYNKLGSHPLSCHNFVLRSKLIDCDTLDV